MVEFLRDLQDLPTSAPRQIWQTFVDVFLMFGNVSGKNLEYVFLVDVPLMYLVDEIWLELKISYQTVKFLTAYLNIEE